MRKRAFTWSLTGIAAVIGFMLTVQITSRPQGPSTGSTSYLDLRTRLAEQLQEHRSLTSDVSKASTQLAQFEAAQGSQGLLQNALRRDATVVEAEAGMTPVSGAGLVVVIKDDPSLPFVQGISGTFPQHADEEVSQIVNDLYANGATAISINGQRLVTTSSIRLIASLGGLSMLQVNTNPVQMPYVIKAIGNISLMNAILQLDEIPLTLKLMQEHCIIRPYPGPHGVQVPAYRGSLPGAWAKEVRSE